MADPVPLSYASPDTPEGVMSRQLDDGGVEIAVPMSIAYPPGALTRWFMRVLRAPLMMRLTVTLSAAGLTIDEPYEQSRIGKKRQSWPLEKIGEIRRPKYEAGVYISIPGEDFLELISECPKPVQQFVTNTLAAALARLRAARPGQ